MEGKSSKADFDNSSQLNVDKNTKDFTHEEVHSKLTAYEQLAGEIHSSKQFMKDLREHYKNKIEKADVNSGIQGKHFQDGVNAGVHSYKQRIDLELNFDQNLQNIRNDIMAVAKGHYKPNYSLAKNFKEAVQEKDKDLGIEK